MRDDQIQRGRRKKRPNINIVPILLAVIVILLAVVVVLLVNNLGGKGDNSSNTSSLVESSIGNGSSDGTDNSANNSSKTVSVSSSSDTATLAGEKSKWYLTLANKDNPLPTNFSPTVSNITAKYAGYPNMKFDSRAVGALNNMCAAAAKDGVNLLVISSYRTITRQTQLYNQEIAKQKANNPTYTDEQAAAAASTVVAIPGTSEHNLGLAVDFNSAEQSFENSNQSKWLRAHAEEYGFVLRYPKDKYDITKIIYEPWHYRYVGVDHAKRMNNMKLCLEEYIDYLKNLG